MIKCFKGVNAYVEGKGIVKTDLSFSDKILSVDLGAMGEEISLPDGALVLPGFIDEHIHAAGGFDTMDASISALESFADTLAKEGTTSFLATSMTQSEENILRAMSAVKGYLDKNRDDGARLIGVHLEGPFISSKMVGAQPIEYVAEPNAELFDKYNNACGDKIKIITVAPDVDGAEEFIKHVTSKGVVASIGHTPSKYEFVKKAINAGATNVTHTYNAQSGLHHRDIGVVGAALLEDNLCCEIIADTIHVSVPAIKLLVKNKPKDKIVLITDSMRAKGLEDGVSELGGQTVYVKNGEARLKDGTLAGSVLKMNDAIKNMVEKVGLSITDVVDYCTINPARNLNMSDEIGSIKVGKSADFAVLDKDYSVILTVRQGKIIYKK